MSQHNPGSPPHQTRCSFNFKPIIRDQEKRVSFRTKQNSHVPKMKDPRGTKTKTLVLTLMFSTLVKQWPKMPLIKNKIVAVYHCNEIQEALTLWHQKSRFFQLCEHTLPTCQK